MTPPRTLSALSRYGGEPMPDPSLGAALAASGGGSAFQRWDEFLAPVVAIKHSFAKGMRWSVLGLCVLDCEGIPSASPGQTPPRHGVRALSLT